MRVVLLITSLMVGAALAAPRVRNLVLSHDLKSDVLDVASRYLGREKAVQLVKMGDPKGQILADLQAILANLVAEQNTATNAFNSANTAATNAINQNTLNLAARQADLATASSAVTADQGCINSKTADLNNDQAAVAAQNVLITQRKADLENAKTATNAAQADLNAIIAAHQDSIATVKVLIGMIDSNDFGPVMLKTLDEIDPAMLHKDVTGISMLIQEAMEAAVPISTTSAPKKPTSNAELQADLDNILNKIVSGLTDSLNLYLKQLDTEKTNYNNAVTSLNALIAGYQAQIVNLNVQVGKDQTAIATCQASLTGDQASVVAANSAIANLNTLLASQKQAQKDAADAYANATASRQKQLTSIEACIQYVNDKIVGMTVAGLCNVGSPSCPRCLCAENCPSGQTCGDDAKCVAPPVTKQIGGVTQTKGGEGLTLTMNCPTGMKIISIDFASYGTPNGVFPSFSKSSCHASSSSSVTANQCKVGSASCSIVENNALYGDPCSGTPKRLAVVATCSA